ncbi:hypothetical protein BDF14DRAFT_1375352 [Spinellus fusiger]|nr:hypothetical protein BDF14DRAFT_1375352 [Spinellus fusiger]
MINSLPWLFISTIGWISTRVILLKSKEQQNHGLVTRQHRFMNLPRLFSHTIRPILHLLVVYLVSMPSFFLPIISMLFENHEENNSIISYLGTLLGFLVGPSGATHVFILSLSFSLSLHYLHYHYEAITYIQKLSDLSLVKSTYNFS